MTQRGGATDASANRPRRWELFVVAGSSLLLVALILAHVPLINGPPYWAWPWRRLDVLPIVVFLGTAVLPFALAQALHQRELGRPGVRIALLMLAAFLFMLGGSAAQENPPSLGRIARVVENPVATSFYTDAETFVDHPNLLAAYPRIHRFMHLHTVNKPPGQVLYYRTAIRLARSGFLGRSPHVAAMAGGIALGLLACLAVPATYWLCLRFRLRRDDAFHAASFFSMFPGYVLFFPEFDQIFAVFSCLLVGLWLLALERDRALYSIPVGVTLAMILFFSYSLLVLGAIMLAAFFLRLRSHSSPPASTLGLIRHGGAVLATTVGCYLLLWLFTGYDPIATARSIFANHGELLLRQNRPYLWTLIFDPWDFWLATGSAAGVLVVLRLLRPDSDGADHTRRMRILRVCLAQIMIVPLFGLFRGESARLWIFSMPLMALAGALAISGWSFRERMLVYACQWLVLAAICQNMIYIRV